MARIRDWKGMREMSARLLLDLGLRLEGENPGGRWQPRRFTRPCYFRSASQRAMKWIPRRWIGCSEPMIGTAEKMK
jgi:hypothetical protein